MGVLRERRIYARGDADRAGANSSHPPSGIPFPARLTSTGASPILSPSTELELNQGRCPLAAPFNDGVWYDPADEQFKMWYHAGWFDGTALATSSDGLQTVLC